MIWVVLAENLTFAVVPDMALAMNLQARQMVTKVNLCRHVV
jgi:hypothetical protein